ncbi:hypothetical protein [Photobacterium phosphoreum]|uniref:hypothetical protein n=1 Tax=Photobacterium phosphoreum TaxID=659 RepID=UPI001E40FBC5|nr:hypothetical protein [Photobacterium phosphoreum]MCD9477856.1 hypothetical protein [Photobacterium phosphoreum]
MANRKTIALRTLQLTYHPMLAQIITEDSVQLINQAQLGCITDKELAVLFAQIALPVTPHPTMTDQYCLLAPCPAFFFLQQHSLSTTLKVQIQIYPVDEVESVIHTLSFIEPSLYHGLQAKPLHNLSKRHQLAKQHHQSVPSKQKLALLANTSPSAVRH